MVWEILVRLLHRDKQAELIFGATYATFDELLEWSDFLIITAPLTLETRHIFSLREFKKMKKTAVLVNIGRGAIIRESDLAAALSEKIIYAAGLDATKENMAICCAESVISVLKGGITPDTAINKTVLI